MPNSNNEIKPTKILELQTYNRAQEILKKSLINSSALQENKEMSINADPITRSKKFKILKKISIQYLRKSLRYFFSRQPSKTLYFKALKSFYKGYKLYLYSFLIFVKLKLLTNLHLFKRSYTPQETVSKYYFRSLYPRIKTTKKYVFNLLTTIRRLLKTNIKSFSLVKKILLLNYKKNLRAYSSSSIVLSSFFKIDKKVLMYFYQFVEIGSKQLNSLQLGNLILSFKNKFNVSLAKLKNLLCLLKNNLFEVLSGDKKQITPYLERLSLVISIYFLPFVFLATQALIPLIDEYEYLIVNPLSSSIFSKVPFLFDLIKLLRPLITNPLFLFWVPLGYYLTFTSAYRSLQISYKTAYNGTIAAIFLIINYSCVLLQFMMNLAYQSIKITKDMFFTSYLIKHLGKNKNKERDEALKIFANLVNRYDSEIRKNYYDFLLVLNHRIFSHLALISLAALVYNCIYYIIHNKNPEIILVTKTALATIKNPQEED